MYLKKIIKSNAEDKFFSSSFKIKDETLKKYTYAFILFYNVLK